MKYLVIIFIALLFQDLPYKPNDEFEIKLNYRFKPRPHRDPNTVNLSETQREYEARTSSDQLPYLALNVQMLKLPQGEVRLRITNNLDQHSATKKIEEGSIIPIEVGFTSDVKDRLTAHQYVLTFLSSAKTEINKIVIFIGEDGSFLVNEQKRGKF